ncbi:SGNH hydrolase-type esterase domain-containing protein [Nocardia ninae]|uniref:Minor tail protein gp31 C-terminal domain-containing protein n=1 Tax=Nocardia ninae NBRC 108245 TaxID=1210091 RepID=A0A511MMZ4_9NOCA|nr:hypothetical protein [Nocardia ninae]GEM41992.1 hypothetical protein NN4_65110 [Nocardia ninae NBRC 108245]
MSLEAIEPDVLELGDVQQREGDLLLPVIGPAGPQGAKGDKGDKGDAGNVGAPGAQGPKGDKGDKGDTGDVGPKGDGLRIDGQVTTYAELPTSGLATGDVWLAGGKLYRWAGAWPAEAAGTPVQGAKGDKGDEGDKGDTGSAGAPGAAGADGAPGATGPKGDKGDKGDTGSQGAQGIPGTPGAAGADGATGATGPKGDKGDKGDPGGPTRPTTRLMTFGNGGMDQTVAGNLSAATQWGIRIPVRLPVTPTRARLRLRNYGMTNVASVNLTGKGIIMGTHTLDGSGNGTGNFAGATATTIVAGDFTIPGDGSYYTSPWFNMAGNTDLLFAIGYMMASTAMKTTIGQCFIWNTSAAALNPATTGGTVPAGIPLDFLIEYEVPVASNASAWLFIGDSIEEVVTGPQGTSASSIVPIPIHQCQPQRWAAANNTLVQNLSMAGVTAAVFADPASFPEFWSRQNIVAANLDGAIISVGSNDVFPGGRTLAQYQADIQKIVTKVKQLIGYDKPIYFGNIIPRNDSSAKNTVRLQANAWLATLPFGAKGCIDFDVVMRQGSSTTTLDPVKTVDNIHPSYAGVDAMVSKLAMSIATAVAAPPASPWVVMTQAQYDALNGARDPNQLYVIVG